MRRRSAQRERLSADSSSSTTERGCNNVQREGGEGGERGRMEGGMVFIRFRTPTTALSGRCSVSIRFAPLIEQEAVLLLLLLPP